MTPKAALKVESDDTRMDARYFRQLFSKDAASLHHTGCLKMNGLDSQRISRYSTLEKEMAS